MPLNKKNTAISIFFALSGVEALMVIYALLILPTDPKNMGVWGLSSSRLSVLSLFLLLAAGCFSLAYFLFRNRNLHCFRRFAWVKLPAIQFRLFIIISVILVISILLLIIDRSVLGRYTELYIRLVPPLIWVGLTSLQLLVVFVMIGNIELVAMRNLLALVIAFIFPLIVFLPYVVTIKDYFLGIGNDFIPFYYDYKLYLLDHLSHFSIPPWSPSEGAGYPFVANPLTQAYYPLNIIPAFLYRVFDGYTSLEYQRYTILAVSVFTLGLFCWLKQIRVGSNVRAILFAALILGVSFRITDLIRTVNALHAAAWYPWILFSVTGILLSRQLRKAIGFGFLLFLFIIFLLTAGYPYNIYYFLFLVVPYLMVISIPALRRYLITDQPVHYKSGLLVSIIASLSSLLVCFPYLYETGILLSQTTDRSGGDLAFSTGYIFDFTDTLGSLVYPPASMGDGWYYFGILGLILILLYMFSTRAARINNPSSRCFSLRPILFNPESQVKLFFLIWIVVITLISYGEKSLLFMALWKFLPLFSSMRIIARINIVLVPILAWLLALAYDHFENQLLSLYNSSRNSIKKPLIILAVSMFSVLGMQIYLIQNGRFDEYWVIFRQRINFLVDSISMNYHISLPEPVTIINILEKWPVVILLLAGIALIMVFFYSKNHYIGTNQLRILLLLLVFLSTLDTIAIGPWFWAGGLVAKETRRNLDISRSNIQSFTTPRVDTGGRISHSEVFNVSQDKFWYYKRYNDFINTSQNQLEARRQLLGVKDGKKLFFSERIDHSSIQSFLDDANNYPDNITVISYSGDRLELNIKVPNDGYCSFIDNWDPHWNASIDGETVPISLLFGTFKSIQIPSDSHSVVFTYHPQFELFQALKSPIR